jgi:hypothetical protein
MSGRPSSLRETKSRPRVVWVLAAYNTFLSFVMMGSFLRVSDFIWMRYTDAMTPPNRPPTLPNWTDFRDSAYQMVLRMAQFEKRASGKPYEADTG